MRARRLCRACRAGIVRRGSAEPRERARRAAADRPALPGTRSTELHGRAKRLWSGRRRPGRRTHTATRSRTPGVSGPAGYAMAALSATGYGDAAQAAAQQAGINVESLAAIGQVESNFRNIGTANGSTSANGFWQITNGTWNGTVARDGLGTLDRSNPADQATVASNIIRDTAQTVSNTTGQPATTLEVYGGYLFGLRICRGTSDRGRLHHPAERDRPGGIHSRTTGCRTDRRGFSEPDGREVGIGREPGGADDRRVMLGLEQHRQLGEMRTAGLVEAAAFRVGRSRLVRISRSSGIVTPPPVFAQPAEPC